MGRPNVRRANRVAALYDTHGNLPALEAVLAELEVVRPDAIVVGGDDVLGPMPRETFDRLKALGERAVFIRGNTDRALVEAPEPPWDEWEEWRRYAADRLEPEELGFLARLPETAPLDVEGLGPVLFCHGSPRSDEEIVTRATPEERLAEILAGVEERVVVCGHTHVQFDRTVGSVRVVNAGSVGMPYEAEQGAYWALLGPDIELRRTPYDAERAAERIRATGFPRAEEWIAGYLLSAPTAEEATEQFERMAEERA